ncbi:coagulation factor XI-like [Pagrus major]|uniref:coagulation factor XI-like n=1 Tax=Pagrus major TaxID=143350 RepID=UPI003CC8E11E
MGIYLILVGLLSICSLSLSQDCNPGHVVNVDFPGTDITSVYSPDADHCQQLCTQHPSCLFFTFIRGDWTRDNRHFYCYLKSTPTGEPKVQTPLMGVTSGYSLKPCSPDLKPCLSQVYQNMDFYGADYRTLFTANYEECERACTQDSGCQFFTFVNEVFQVEKIRFKCHLKFSWTIPRPPVVRVLRNVVSGFSHNIQMGQQLDTACQGKLFPHADIPGGNIMVLPAASPEQCQTLCSTHPKCTFFSFASNGLSCQLKSDQDFLVIRDNDGITSGLPAHFCQLDNNWVKVAHEDVDFNGSDIRYVLLDDAETCQRTCTEDALCQFYSYVKANFTDPTHRRRCYLKRSITMPAPPKVAKLANVVSGFTLRNCVSAPSHT